MINPGERLFNPVAGEAMTFVTTSSERAASTSRSNSEPGPMRSWLPLTFIRRTSRLDAISASLMNRCRNRSSALNSGVSSFSATALAAWRAVRQSHPSLPARLAISRGSRQ